MFSYSDVTHATVMHVGSRAPSRPAPISSSSGRIARCSRPSGPVIAISALRTGCGKSQTSRWLSAPRARGHKVAVFRHPMPYGDLAAQRLERFATLADMDRHHCTIEEREEYEPHIQAGNLVFAGSTTRRSPRPRRPSVGRRRVGRRQQRFPLRPAGSAHRDVDALRPDHITTHHPGETVVRMADIVVINKVDVAAAADVERVADAVRHVNPRATIVRAASPVKLADAARWPQARACDRGRPHHHARHAVRRGYVAAVAAKAGVIVIHAAATPEIRAVYAQYPHIGRVLPAVGYDEVQLDALRRTIEASDAEVVISA